jgi:hypothetical protein
LSTHATAAIITDEEDTHFSGGLSEIHFAAGY